MKANISLLLPNIIGEFVLPNGNISHKAAYTWLWYQVVTVVIGPCGTVEETTATSRQTPNPSDPHKGSSHCSLRCWPSNDLCPRLHVKMAN